MAKRSLIEELDQAVEGIIGNPNAPLPDVDRRIAPLVRIAAELRGLPSAEFQARLGSELLPSEVTADRTGEAGAALIAGGLAGPLKTDNQIQGRLRELAAAAELKPQDIRAALGELPEMSMRFLASIDQCTVGVSRFSDQTAHWERHPGGDELLHVLDGELDVTTLTEAGLEHTIVPAGSIFVCPRGLWHWPRPLPTVSLLFVTPEKGTENSRARDPRLKAGRALVGEDGQVPRRPSGADTVRSQTSGPAMIAQDLRAALSSVPMLAINAGTTGEEAGAAFPQLGVLNECGLFVGRFSGLSPWECHRGGDELLHILEGEVEITTLTDTGPVRNTLRAGSVFVCPRGLWHRQYSAAGAMAFSATPQPSEVSFAEDPRL